MFYCPVIKKSSELLKVKLIYYINHSNCKKMATELSFNACVKCNHGGTDFNH